MDFRRPGGEAAGLRHRAAGPAGRRRARCSSCRASRARAAAGETERLSQFGSTACKALFRCRRVPRTFRLFQAALSAHPHVAPLSSLPIAASSAKRRMRQSCSPSRRPRDDYRFTQGQHLTLRAELDGEEVRRSYSICSGCDDGGCAWRSSGCRRAVLRLGQREADAGRCARRDAPDGRFFTPLAAGSAALRGLRRRQRDHAGALADPDHARARAGSASRWSTATAPACIMFREALEDLKDRYMGRFPLHNVLSREPQDVPLFSGRIDAEKCRTLLAAVLPAGDIDEAFICGPGRCSRRSRVADRRRRRSRAHPCRALPRRGARPARPRRPNRRTALRRPRSW